jgi:hypothetical protein
MLNEEYTMQSPKVKTKADHLIMLWGTYNIVTQSFLEEVSPDILHEIF